MSPIEIIFKEIKPLYAKLSQTNAEMISAG